MFGHVDRQTSVVPHLQRLRTACCITILRNVDNCGVTYQKNWVFFATVYHYTSYVFLVSRARCVSLRSPFLIYSLWQYFMRLVIMQCLLQLLIIWRWLINWNCARSWLAFFCEMFIGCMPQRWCFHARPSYTRDTDGSRQTKEWLFVYRSGVAMFCVVSEP
jgi:hypothetical protein